MILIRMRMTAEVYARVEQMMVGSLLGNGRKKELRSIFRFVNIVVAGSGDGDILGDQAIGAQGNFRRDVCLIFEYAA